MEIKAEVKKVESLKDFFFVVPDYQREYVWDKDKNVSRFLLDISGEFDSNPHSNYFIGSSIVVKNKDGAWDVIDGQQRLTTIIISLCAMRSVLESLDLKKLDIEEDLINGLEEQRKELEKVINELLYSYSIKDKKKRVRLILQYEESKDYLTCLISDKKFEDETTPSISKMTDAFDTVCNYLVELQNSDVSNLLDFISFFLGNVEMVVIMPDNIGSALKIFETINERGVGLNAMDLLKNLIFSKSKEEHFSKIKDIWKGIVSSLNECGEGDKPLRFLRYFLVARYHDGIIREDEIYKWIISDAGKKKIGYEHNALNFAKELLKASKKYSDFVQATESIEDHAIYPNITGIGYVAKKNSRQHLILLLAANDNSYTDSDINLLAENIETLMFYYSTGNILTKYYEPLFASWAQKIRRLKTIIELKDFIKASIGDEVNKRQAELNLKFPLIRQYDLQPLYRVKYILGRIENYIRSNTNFPVNDNKYYQLQQLEHILPQKGENIPTTIYPSEIDYFANVYKVGNLTLVEAPVNGSLNFTNDLSSNTWFTKKKAAYQASSILITRSLDNVLVGKNSAYNQFAQANLKAFNDWGIKEIATRQDMIHKLIPKVWQVTV